MQGIFGVGPLEVLFILVLVLLIFGPERLPELTRNLGNAIRRLKETYVAFVTEFKDELTPIATEIDAATRDLRKDLAEIRDAADIRGLIPTIGSEDIGKTSPDLAISQPAATVAPAITALEPENKIAMPPVTAIGTNGTNGHSAGAQSAGARLQPGRTTSVKIELPDDNPWASLGAPIRSDQLDDDNPWRN
jgi:TatA/E family protein of Tat protein translocase